MLMNSCYVNNRKTMLIYEKYAYDGLNLLWLFPDQHKSLNIRSLLPGNSFPFLQVENGNINGKEKIPSPARIP